MFVEAALGDAYGAGFEYADLVIVATENDGKHYRKHRVPAGHYTDDTQMAIALAMAMIRANSGKNTWQDLTSVDVADQFVAQFMADPRLGYSQGLYDILRETVTALAKVKKGSGGMEFLRRVKPHSAKSGGAMRAWPCGLLPTLEEAVDCAIFQAGITHATREGLDAAAAVAAFVWCARQGYEGETILDTLNAVAPGYLWNIPWTGAVGSSGIAAVKAAVTAVCNLDPDQPITMSMLDILKASVAFTGDVDTVACIALAGASVHSGIVNDLPESLYKGLERGNYGIEFLKSLDERMATEFPLPEPEPEPEGVTAVNPVSEILLECFEPCVLEESKLEPADSESECQPVRCGTFDPDYKSPVLEKLRQRKRKADSDTGVLDLFDPEDGNVNRR